MRRILQAGTVVLALSLPATAAGQTLFGVAPHIGTLGIGVDVGLSLPGPVGFRVGGNVMPVELNLTESDVDYTISFPSPQYTLMADLSTPIGFRVTGGLLVSPGHFDGNAEFTQSIDINGTVYTSNEISTLTVSIVNKDVAPYVGIGWGSPGRSRFGFFTDLGVALQGSPSVVVAATGAGTTLPSFVTNLEQERQSLEADITQFKYYPVLTIGFSIGL